MTEMKGRVLIIAGSDPSGGAGIQADIKTVTALGGYAMTAITALTVQNTQGVSEVLDVAPEFIRQQIIAVLSDIGADAIKIGMIGSVQAGAAIMSALEECGWRQEHGEPVTWTAPLVVDPVLAATSGDRLAKDGVAKFLKETLLPVASIVTPNSLELSVLAGRDVTDGESLERAAQTLIAAGVKAVLAKGGHLSGASLIDRLATQSDVHRFTHDRINTTSTHGTGCTLASAVATGLAQGMSLYDATERAIRYVQGAIKSAPHYGAGNGPLNHAHALDEF